MPIEMPEGVQFIQLTQQKFAELWEKMSTIPGILDDFHREPQWLVQQLQAPDTVWLERTDGNGILYMTDVIRGLGATGHILYWDKRLRGREQFTLDVLKWLVTAIPLQKVNVFLPDYAKAAQSFTQRMGFKKEGTLRRWSVSQGKPYDMLVYGMLAEEVMVQEVYDGREQKSEDTDDRSNELGVRSSVDGHAESVHEGEQRPAVEYEHTSA